MSWYWSLLGVAVVSVLFLVQRSVLRIRSRKVYRRWLVAARCKADALVTAAEAEIKSMHDKAVLELGPLIANEYAKARREAKQSAELELVKARQDLANEVTAARAAITKEREIAVQDAQRKARSDALLLAYNEAAGTLGLTIATAVEELESRRRNVPIDTAAAYPNIYDTGEAWVVRVLDGNIRHVEVFTYTNRNEKAQRLVDAVRCRNTLASAEQSQHAAVYEECVVQARQLYGDGPHIHVKAAEQFHVRMTQAGDRVDHFRFVGTDPEDRFQIADHTILTEPLGTLVNDNRRVLDAFATLGLDHRRTVRDLLLLTGDELLEAVGFGAASLRRLRTGLAEYGLALWADVAPAAPPSPREPGDRNFRAIEFE